MQSSSIQIAIVIGLASWSSITDSHLETRQQPFELKGEITSARYCEDADEIHSLMLHLRWTLRNTADSSKAVYVQFPAVIGGVIAANGEALSAGTHEADFEDDVLRQGQFDPKYIRVLPAGAALTFETPGEFAVLTFTDRTKVPGMIGPGEHVMQLRLATWPFGPASTPAWKSKLAQFGDLWTDVLVSLPVALTVPGSPTFVDCGR